MLERRGGSSSDTNGGVGLQIEDVSITNRNQPPRPQQHQQHNQRYHELPKLAHHGNGPHALPSIMTMNPHNQEQRHKQQHHASGSTNYHISSMAQMSASQPQQQYAQHYPQQQPQLDVREVWIGFQQHCADQHQRQLQHCKLQHQQQQQQRASYDEETQLRFLLQQQQKQGQDDASILQNWQKQKTLQQQQMLLAMESNQQQIELEQLVQQKLALEIQQQKLQMEEAIKKEQRVKQKRALEMVQQKALPTNVGLSSPPRASKLPTDVRLGDVGWAWSSLTGSDETDLLSCDGAKDTEDGQQEMKGGEAQSLLKPNSNQISVDESSASTVKYLSYPEIPGKDEIPLNFISSSLVHRDGDLQRPSVALPPSLPPPSLHQSVIDRQRKLKELLQSAITTKGHVVKAHTSELNEGILSSLSSSALTTNIERSTRTLSNKKSETSKHNASNQRLFSSTITHPRPKKREDQQQRQGEHFYTSTTLTAYNKPSPNSKELKAASVPKRSKSPTIAQPVAVSKNKLLPLSSDRVEARTVSESSRSRLDLSDILSLSDDSHFSTGYVAAETYQSNKKRSRSAVDKDEGDNDIPHEVDIDGTNYDDEFVDDLPDCISWNHHKKRYIDRDGLAILATKVKDRYYASSPSLMAISNDRPPHKEGGRRQICWFNLLRVAGPTSSSDKCESVQKRKNANANIKKGMLKRTDSPLSQSSPAPTTTQSDRLTKKKKQTAEHVSAEDMCAVRDEHTIRQQDSDLDIDSQGSFDRRQTSKSDHMKRKTASSSTTMANLSIHTPYAEKITESASSSLDVCRKTDDSISLYSTQTLTSIDNPTQSTLTIIDDPSLMTEIISVLTSVADQPQLHPTLNGRFLKYPAFPAKGLPPSWTVCKIPRNNKRHQAFDCHYFSPKMLYRFRSTKEVKRYLSYLDKNNGGEEKAIQMFHSEGNESKSISDNLSRLTSSNKSSHRVVEIIKPSKSKSFDTDTSDEPNNPTTPTGYIKPIIKKGEKVYACWSGPNGDGKEFFPGRVWDVRDNGISSEYGPVMMYDIVYDDGDTESNVHEIWVIKKKEWEMYHRKPEESWIGVTNVTFPTSEDFYANTLGWYKLSSYIDMKNPPVYSSLGDALRAHDRHVIETKGQVYVTAMEVNFPEEHGLVN